MNEFRIKKLSPKISRSRRLSPFLIVFVVSAVLLFSGTFFAYQAITQTPDPISTGEMQFCATSDIYVSAKYLGVTTGSVLDSIRYTNKSQKPCGLKGFPDIKILDSTGRVYTTQAYNLPMASRVERLEPGQSVQSFVIWGNWCGAKPSASLMIQVQIPGTLNFYKSQITDINGNTTKAAPQCTGGKESKSTLAVSPFVSESEVIK